MIVNKNTKLVQAFFFISRIIDGFFRTSAIISTRLPLFFAMSLANSGMLSAACDWQGPYESTSITKTNFVYGEAVTELQFNALPQTPDLLTNCGNYVEKVSTKKVLGELITPAVRNYPTYLAQDFGYQWSDLEPYNGPYQTCEDALNANLTRYNNNSSPYHFDFISGDIYYWKNYGNTQNAYIKDSQGLITPAIIGGLWQYTPGPNRIVLTVGTRYLTPGTGWMTCFATADPINGVEPAGTVSDATYRLITAITTTATQLCTAPRIQNTTTCSLPPNTSDPKKNNACSGSSEGNPCNVGTGNKFQYELDYVQNAPFPLRIERIYNSIHRETGVFGSNWKGSDERSIEFVTNGAINTAVVKHGNGNQFSFNKIGSNWVSDSDVNSALIQVLNANGSVLGWRYKNDYDELEFYDETGRLVSISDRVGNRHTFTYACPSSVVCHPLAAIISSVTDSLGRQITFSSDSNGRIMGATDPSGNIYSYSYSYFDSHPEKSNLALITFPDGRRRSYAYNESSNVSSSPDSGVSYAHALTGLFDEKYQRFANWKYDAQGRGISSEHAVGIGKVNITYNGDGTTSVLDAIGGVRSYQFEVAQGVTKSTQIARGNDNALELNVRDSNGNVINRTNFNGVVTTYSYDLSRNLETQRVEASGKPEARTVSTQWHSYWRLPVKVAEPKKLTTWVYNGDGGTSCAPTTATVPSINGGSQLIGVLCSKIEQATNDANGSSGFAAAVTGTPRTWTFTYNQYGQVLTANGPRTDVADITTTTYYDAIDPDMSKRGNLATTTNALGHVTQITAYDLNGNPLTIIDPNGVTTTLTYDLRQRLTSRSVGGETTTYTYDAVGQLLKVTLPDGSYTANTYDPAHRLTEISDALGNRIVYTLDAMGNRTKEEVKDPAGQLARTRSRIYDALNRLAQDIGAQGQTTRYEYDANGNRTKVTDPLNQLTVSTYDPLNRLIQVTDPGLGQTRYGYDGKDRLAQVTDPRNLITTYTVDGLGNRQILQSPDTGSTISTYDAAGNELTRTDARGQVSTTLYDALNRPTRITYQDGSRVQYTWDLGSNGLGRLGKIDEYDAGGTLLRSLASSYDSQGRLLGETRTLGSVAHTIAYSYSAGQLNGLTLPSAKQLAYIRNAAGQITQVTLTANGQSKTLLQNIAYHPFGGLKSFTDGAGQTHSRGNDQDGRTSSYTLGNQTWMLSYDAASRIAGQIDAGNAANSATYGYDGLDRLTGATLPATTYGYGYDATGNRTTQTTGSTTRTYTTAATSNRLQSLTNPSQTLGYDANGSLTGDGSNQYAYDTRGRLTQAITAAGTTTYQVNALGQRVRKTNGTNGTDVLYHYDLAGHLLAESNANGSIVREYVWLDDIPVAVLQ